MTTHERGCCRYLQPILHPWGMDNKADGIMPSALGAVRVAYAADAGSAGPRGRGDAALREASAAALCGCAAVCCSAISWPGGAWAGSGQREGEGGGGGDDLQHQLGSIVRCANGTMVAAGYGGARRRARPGAILKASRQALAAAACASSLADIEGLLTGLLSVVLPAACSCLHARNTARGRPIALRQTTARQV